MSDTLMQQIIIKMNNKSRNKYAMNYTYYDTKRRKLI